MIDTLIPVQRVGVNLGLKEWTFHLCYSMELDRPNNPRIFLISVDLVNICHIS